MTMFSRYDIPMLVPLRCAATAVALALAGCASTPAPRELVDARQAVNHANDGPAHTLVPAQVLAAQQALARAEQSFIDAPDAPRTRDLAYIAQRRAEIAETQGALAADHNDKTQAQEDLARLQAERQTHTQEQLSETRQELASERQALAVQSQQLTSEQRARRAAEHSASAAVASLEKIAAVKEEQRGLVITLNGAVLFTTGQSALLPIAQDRLQQVARALNDNPSGTILVEGHTDSVGSQSANEELSRLRAAAVREYLINWGVAANRIRAVGIGPNRPIADNKTPEGRANNRRVEIVIENRAP
jgi:outer membrane protein OmpA-like peptidoglycan-associated protein